MTRRSAGTPPPPNVRAAAAGLLCLAACAPSATLDGPATGEEYAHVRQALDAYEAAGFLAGPPDFPVVGRTVVLPGPADSVLLGFAASMPASALSFAREGDLFAAHYQVLLTVRSGSDTLRRIDRREIVRVEEFAETRSDEPRILFQWFAVVPTDSPALDVTVRQLTSRREARHTFRPRIPHGLSPPVLAYRIEPRRAFGEPPEMIVAARATASASSDPPAVLIEAGRGRQGPARLVIEHAGAEVWIDTVRLVSESGGPPSAVVALPMRRIPPGTATLRVERPGEEGVAGAALFIGLAPEWTLPTWEASLEPLAYALGKDTVDAWRNLPPRERAAAWQRFHQRRDPVPDTGINEYMTRYFERMNAANDRFDEPGRAGWETDRGEVLVKLGEPDDERFIRPPRRGAVARIEWEYEESVPTEATIVFEDVSDFGVFVLTPRSRLAVRRVERELAAEGAAPTVQ